MVLMTLRAERLKRYVYREDASPLVGWGSDFAQDNSIRKAQKNMTYSSLTSFKLLERDLDSGCREIAVEGELDMSVAGELKDALARAAREHQRLLIDLRACEFIDSTGIALIVEAHGEADGGGPRIAVHSATGQVLRVLSITGLAQSGLVFETAEEAIAAL